MAQNKLFDILTRLKINICYTKPYFYNGLHKIYYFLTSNWKNTKIQTFVVFTCVSVSRNELENSALSAILRYCLSLNFFSRANSCCVVNGVLGFLFGLCFRRLHLIFGGSPLPSTETKQKITVINQLASVH